MLQENLPCTRMTFLVTRHAPKNPGDVPLAAPSFPCAFLNKGLKHASLTLLLFPSSPKAHPTSLTTKPKLKTSSGQVRKGHHTLQHVTQDLLLTKQRLGHAKAPLHVPSETISLRQHTLDCFLRQQHSPALTTDAAIESLPFGSNLWRPCTASALLKHRQLQLAVQHHVQFLGFSYLQGWKSKTSA